MSLQYLSDCSASAITYFTHLLRSIQIARNNKAIASNGGPSLMCLPDDVLLLILEFVAERGEHYGSDRNASNVALNREFIHFAACNRRLRALASPLLFHTIHLGRSWGPEHMVKSLHTLRQTDNALKSARELNIDLWPAPQQTVPDEVLEELGSLLLSCLSLMKRLDKLSCSTTLPCSDSLRKTFEQAGCDFPQVRELICGPHVGWQIRVCPNVEVISSDDWLILTGPGEDPFPDFIEAAGQATELREFSSNASWDIKRLDMLQKAVPQLRCLGLRGRVVSNLDEVIVVLRRFRHLRSLVLPDASSLPGLDFSDGAFPRDLRSTTKITAAQASTMMAIFQKLPRLAELSLGRQFRASTASELNHPGQLILRWEMDLGLGCSQETYRNEYRIQLEHDDMSSVHHAEDEMEAMYSTAEDSASIYSRADTLAF